MRKVLVVDDEKYRTEVYRDNLKTAGFEVLYRRTIDEASEVLNDPEQKDIQLLIQDLQMGRPLPDNRLTMSNADWEQFNRLAGLWFLVTHRDLLFSRKIPIAILTNRKPDEYDTIVDEKIETAGIPVRVFRKLETPAKDLSGKVKSFLDDIRAWAWARPDLNTMNQAP